jgi:FAD/FMN-containing dehydrogenase
LKPSPLASAEDRRAARQTKGVPVTTTTPREQVGSNNRLIRPELVGSHNGNRPILGGVLGDAVAKELAPGSRGPLYMAGDPEYDAECAGYNRAIAHRPAIVAGVTGAADIMAAVAFATKHGLPVGVLNTGHGASVAADDAVLISTKRMRGVTVDPYLRTARVQAGVTWDQVIHEAAPFGLAPLCGSSPAVGVVGFVLGGGLPILGRAYGYAADNVRSIDVVTAHGMLRRVTPDQYADLFWALRGGKGNFGVVTAIEIDLVPVTRVYGGGLYFPGSQAAAVLNAYRRWVKRVPEQMSSSITLTRFPWEDTVPAELRGRFVVHLRLAYAGSAADGESLVRPLRTAALPLLDTVAEIPYTAIGGIHNDPTDPFPLHERTACLRELDEDGLDRLIHLAGPDSTCPLRLVELRHLGGALSREPAIPNAVGNRDAEFLLYLTGLTTSGAEVVHSAELILDQLAPWCTGGVNINFLGVSDAEPERVRAAYPADAYRRLRRTKRAYDPENIFRINHNIPPGNG